VPTAFSNCPIFFIDGLLCKTCITCFTNWNYLFNGAPCILQRKSKHSQIPQIEVADSSAPNPLPLECLFVHLLHLLLEHSTVEMTSMHKSGNCASALAAVLDAIFWSNRAAKNMECVSSRNTFSDTTADNDEDVNAIFWSKHAVKKMERDSSRNTCCDTATDDDDDDDIESVAFEESLMDKLGLTRSVGFADDYDGDDKSISTPTTMSPPPSEPGTPRQLSPLAWERSSHTPRSPASRAAVRTASAPCGTRCQRTVIRETHTEILVNGIVVGPIPVV